MGKVSYCMRDLEYNMKYCEHQLIKARVSSFVLHNVTDGQDVEKHKGFSYYAYFAKPPWCKILIEIPDSEIDKLEAILNDQL